MITQNALQSLRHEDKDLYTQLYNRRGFLSVAEYLLEHCQREKSLATIYYFELNNFSSLIAEHGDLVEKEVVEKFVDFLKNTFRKTDLLARIDKERFVATTTHNENFRPELLLHRFSEKIKLYNSLSDNQLKVKLRSGSITSQPEYLQVTGRLLDLVDKKMFEKQFTEAYSVNV